MHWHELIIHSHEEATDAIAASLQVLGAGGVAIEESWTKHEGKTTPLGEWYEVPDNDIPPGQAIVKAYFSAESASPEELRLQAEQLLEQIKSAGTEIGPGKIALGKVSEEDWEHSWKKYYHPVRVTEKLTVKPTWEAYEPTEGEIVVELDPGMAFGTGTHETTNLCMQLLESYVKPGDRVIDVGTGSGILAVVCAKLGAAKVTAIDLDPVAVSSAKANAQLNATSDRIAVYEGDLLSVVKNTEAKHGLPADIIVANILAEIILRLADDAFEALRPGGVFVASGIIKQKRAEVEAALKAAGFAIKETKQDKDWIAMIAVKQ